MYYSSRDRSSEGFPRDGSTRSTLPSPFFNWRAGINLPCGSKLLSPNVNWQFRGAMYLGEGLNTFDERISDNFIFVPSSLYNSSCCLSSRSSSFQDDDCRSNLFLNDIEIRFEIDPPRNLPEEVFKRFGTFEDIHWIECNTLLITFDDTR